jgi:hypothetical protein
MRQITLQEFHAELKAQGMARRSDAAFKCPICGTVQSIVSLLAAGVPEDLVETQVGFSCEGRWTKAGPFKRARHGSPSPRGCDWTLGGLFKLHTLEVIMPDGSVQPVFEISTHDEAMALAAELDK